MALGKRKKTDSSLLFIPAQALVGAPANYFYDRLNALLDSHGFDAFAEKLCLGFYADGVGRPSMPPGVYFRCMMVGYFEGIDSERGIAWRLADSLSVRRFVGVGLDQIAPDHSTISRTRRKIDHKTHQEVFTFILKILAENKLIDGTTLGVDSTPLEANAAMRNIVRRDTGESYQDFLTRLAKESDIETPTREDLAKIDKTRKNKASNADWKSESDPDSRITKMKDGSTHLAHKAEHAVDLGGYGAILAVNLTPADCGDTQTLADTLVLAGENLRQAADELEQERADSASTEVAEEVVEVEMPREVVADKGYHSNQTMEDLSEMGMRSYIPEADRGRRNWEDKREAQEATYANRRRTKGKRGRKLMRKRGELIERSFAHAYETGRMRRLHLRENENIHKRLLIHIGAFNLSLVMRQWIGLGTPRGLQGRLLALISMIWGVIMMIARPPIAILARLGRKPPKEPTSTTRARFSRRRRQNLWRYAPSCEKRAFTTGC